MALFVLASPLLLHVALEEGLASFSPALRRLLNLCLSFTLPDTEEATCDFNIPEIIQATFYVMLLNDAWDIARGLKLTLEGLRWTTLESWLSINKRALLEVHLRQRVPPGGSLILMSGQEESSGSNDPLPPLVMSIMSFLCRSFLRYDFHPCKAERESEGDRERENFPMACPDFLSTEQATVCVRVTFLWFLMEDSHPPQPLPKDYHGLCPTLTSTWSKSLP
ncbi:LOW QUALITY PROTEIN: hypothetical protein Cgig2_032279 [Carnegiea gigantea]|uniref:Uncharacterized protein n=1 Tax=Carnegiea gigantea TaxID=171969 RepID=A0A9Q1GNV5_9CARY|nr:LOW QUALITY PROTEIN: hypothetical protein Cgig2_032279 [Carnegiea gigantea]